MTLLLEVRAHASWVRSTIDLVVVTAADRAAATCQLLPCKERKLVLINKKEVILIVSKTIRMTSLCRHALDFRCGGLLLGETRLRTRRGFRFCGGDQRTEHVWRLCDRPLETFARSLIQLCSDPTLAGRGGSVSRRDHSQAAGKRATSQAEPTKKKSHTSNASYSSGEGVWGRGASLREAASPPASPHIPLHIFSFFGELFRFAIRLI